MTEMDNLPRSKPLKLACIWRDLGQRAAMHGIPCRARPSYPLKNLDPADRIAILGTQEGSCAEHVCVAYRRRFQEHDAGGSEGDNAASLDEAGQVPRRVLDLAPRSCRKRCSRPRL